MIFPLTVPFSLGIFQQAMFDYQRVEEALRGLVWDKRVRRKRLEHHTITTHVAQILLTYVLSYMQDDLTWCA